MKQFTPKRFSLAGVLASGFVILSGFILSLFVILVFSDSQTRDTVVVLVVFGVIVFIPMLVFRTPLDPAVKKHGRWWMFWRRRKRKKDLMGRYWKRKKGQEEHQPFGTREIVRSSTFVAAPRKPTEP